MACQSEPPTQVCTGVLAEAPSRGGPRSSKDQVGPPRCAEWPHKTGTSEEAEQGQARAGVGSRGGALGCTELSGGAADLNSRPDCASQGSQGRGVFGWLSCVCGQAASRSPACSAQSGAGVSSLGAGACGEQAVCARRCCRACGFGSRGVAGSQGAGRRGHEGMSGPLRTCVGQKGEEGLAGGRVQVTRGAGLGPEFQDRPPGAPPTREHHSPRCTPGHVRSCRDHEGRDLGSPRAGPGRDAYTPPHTPSPHRWVTMAHRLCGCLNPSGTAKSREGCVRPHAPAGRLRTGRDAACKDDPSTHRTRYRGKGRFPLTSKAFGGAKLFFPHQNTAAENMLKGKQKA